MGLWTFILSLLLYKSAPASAGKVEFLKEICIGKKNARCFTVSNRKITRRKLGRILNVRSLNPRQYNDTQKAIEKYLIYASNDDACNEPVEIADFVGESLVRVQKYCASTKVTKALKSAL